MRRWQRTAVPGPDRRSRMSAIGQRHGALRDAARYLRGRGFTGRALDAAIFAVNAELPEPKTEAEVRRAIGDVENKFGADTEPGEPDAGAPPPKVRLTRIADVVAEPVTWIWSGRIPRGKVTVLDGDPGLGKSRSPSRSPRASRWAD